MGLQRVAMVHGGGHAEGCIGVLRGAGVCRGVYRCMGVDMRGVAWGCTGGKGSGGGSVQD